MKKILIFIRNIFVPDNNNMPWVYISGEGRWVKKKPLSTLMRVGIFAGVLLAVGGAGFYFFLNSRADAELTDLKNPVTSKQDRVIFEIKLNPDNDLLPPVAQTQTAAMPQTQNAAIPQTQKTPTVQTQTAAMPQNKNVNTTRIKTTVTPVMTQNGTVAMINNKNAHAAMPQTQTAQTPNIDGLNPEDLRDYWIKIDKGSYTLSLYKGDEIVKVYNVAIGRNPGDKQRRGDHRTPVGDFRITSIEDSSKWKHDFGDGKGKIAGAYGPWFLRLDAGGWKGIGIHGTHDPDSLGTMASEGCIRMDNDEIRELKNYAYRRMRVVIQE